MRADAMNLFTKKLYCATNHEQHWKMVSQVPSEVNTTGYHVYFVQCQKCWCEWGPRQHIKSRYWSEIIDRMEARASVQGKADKEPLVQ